MKPRLEIGADVEIDVSDRLNDATSGIVSHDDRVVVEAPRPKPSPFRSTILALVLSLPLSGWPEGACATIVVGYWTRNEVWFAADSKTISFEDRSFANTLCKIRLIGNRTFVAASGVMTGGRYHYDVWDSFGAAFRRASGVHSIAEDVRVGTNLVRDQFTVFLQDLPRAWRSPGAVPLSVAIFGFDQGNTIPKLYLRDFVVGDRGSDVGGQAMLDCPPHCAAGPFFLGEGTDKAAAYFDAHEGYFERARTIPRVGIRGALEKLVRIGIKARPDICGRPVVSVRVAANGTDWNKSGKKTCQNAPQQSAVRATNTGPAPR